MSSISLNTFSIERKGRKRVGRGIGSGKGVKCGAGDKGQSARSGKSFKRLHAKWVRRLPKIGFRSKMPKIETVTLRQIIESLKVNPSKTSFDFSNRKLIGCGVISSSIDITVKSISKQCKEYLEGRGCTVRLSGMEKNSVSDIK